ncbi:hypothetical protein VTL71DRAFT_5784 [Oculimacula yallundae]|uniref:Uncharacterized protein n=1 Tax=Oculimacula yallundae TaxID=86028 RepID=A0ABR4BZ65_9HELO
MACLVICDTRDWALSLVKYYIHIHITNTNVNSGPDPDLSTGVKTAIGIIVPLFVLAVVGIAVFFIWKRRKGRQPAGSDAGVISECHKAELPTDGHAKELVRAELSGTEANSGYMRADIQELGG